jgi:FlaA1/EpsC-like NDP-sugar epimerase
MKQLSSTSRKIMSNPHFGRSILVTGAGGWIGAALSRVVVDGKPKKLVLLDHSERSLYRIDAELAALDSGVVHKSILGDVCDAELLKEILEVDRPDVIYHTAAYKHVPLLENNPIAAIRNNALGTNTLAEAIRWQGHANLVMVSTDKAVEPSSILGASKRIGELALLRWNSSRTQMRALRLGNVHGSEGSVVPLFRQQISEGGPVTVTHPDADRYFVSLEKALELIVLTASLPGGGGIFVPDLGSPVKIAELATQMIAEAQSTSGDEIPVRFTQLRPGDKKTEKMFGKREGREPTSDRRLFRLKDSTNWPADYDATVQRLTRSVEQRDLASALELLHELVPQYNPSETLLSLRESPSAPV